MARSDTPRDILWDRPQNPSPYVSEALGVEEWQLRRAIHKIKGRSPLRGPDRVIIYRNGDVTDEKGEALGSVYDEV
ncbi:MAG TPA: hypothetical protein VG308_11445 [Stellaceae bacterium]|jgi:hypothetical protein|nr:hypothetical protein [Stellaceae bacterium]